MSVIGTEMVRVAFFFSTRDPSNAQDFVDDRLKSEFIFHNPNATGTCGCGESFSTG